MRADRLAPALAAGVSLLLGASDAAAFCRTTTSPLGGGPAENQAACWTEGAPLYHESQCIPYRVVNGPLTRNARPDVSTALAAGFGAWTAPNATCVPGIDAIELASADRPKILDFVQGGPNENLVGFVSPWVGRDAEDTLALTTLTYNVQSGVILDVDLEINGDIEWALTTPPPADGYDLQAALTHEAGHVLGFAHSPVEGATMAASYVPGSMDQRTLSADDEAAICAAYPHRATRATAAGIVPSTACQLAPGTGEGCGDPVISHGCSASSTTPATEGVTYAAIVAAAAALVLTKRQRRSARASASRRSSEI